MRKFQIIISFLLLFSSIAWVSDAVNLVRNEPRYRNWLVVGAGSYGVVLADDSHAIKVSVLDYGPNMGKNFLEAALLKTLSHKSIPKPTAIKIHKGLRGNFLEIHLPLYTPIKSDNAMDILGQMASVLDYIHGLNIAHRDIGSAHILAHEDIVVLIDWGAADISTASPMKICGTTVGYRDPCQLLMGYGHPRENDIWAFGISLVEIKHNIFRLFPQSQRNSVLDALITQAPSNTVDLNSASLISQWKNGTTTISPRVQDLIKNTKPETYQNHLWKMLRFDPSLRPSAQQLLADTGIKEPNQKLATLERPLLGESKITAVMRRQTYLWLYNLFTTLDLPEHVLFEAMSIADRIFQTSPKAENSKLVANIALYMACDFFSVGWDIELFVKNSGDAFTADTFKKALLELVQNADFNLIFLHTLREYQNEIYLKGLSAKTQTMALTLLMMLEMDEETFEFSNARKWAYINDIITKRRTPSSKKRTFKRRQLCRSFAESLAERPHFSDLCPTQN